MKDLLLDNDGDLAIPLQRGNSDRQHQQLLLVVAKGGFKENPAATVGAMAYLESELYNEFFVEISKRFSEDGMTINKVGMEGTKLVIGAQYNS
jgi:hypothetical protein